MHPEKLLLFGRKVPYQLIQRKLPSKGLLVNPITNSADKSPKNYRKSFLTKLCKSSFKKWTTSANWSYWFKHHIKWITAQIRSPKFKVTSRQSMTWHEPQFHCDHCKNGTHSKRELKNHKKKNFIIILKPMYPLYDKCHVKTEHDLTPIAFVITETQELLRTQV